MVDIQCVTVIMGGREISRPYQKIVFYVFVFDYIHDSATVHNLSPEISHCTDKFQDLVIWWGWTFGILRLC